VFARSFGVVSLSGLAIGSLSHGLDFEALPFLRTMFSGYTLAKTTLRCNSHIAMSKEEGASLDVALFVIP
jgi:hypothetical protein